MDIPTSQAPADTPALPLDECLSELTAGTFSYGFLPALSDLSRDQVRLVERAWAGIPHELRRRLVGSALDLCEENVQYQFGRLFRIGMTDGEADVRQVSIAGLWEDDSRSLIRELIGVARSDDSADVRAAAVRHLADAIAGLTDEDDLSERVGDLLLAIADDDSEPSVVRRRAIEGVGSLDQTEETRDIIREAFEHGDPALEAAALAAMGRSLESMWLSVVRAALPSEDPEIRYEASRALGQLGGADDVPALAERALDEDSDVRLAAVMALGDIGGPGAVRVLRNLADRTDNLDEEAIREALDAALLMNDPMRIPS